MKYALGSAILLLSIATIGCDSAESEDTQQVARIRMLPESASIEVGEQAEFSFAALNAAGETVDDADLDVRWWSSDTTVFTVSNDGTALGVDAGEAYCMVEVTELSKAARFTGRDSAFVTVLF